MNESFLSQKHHALIKLEMARSGQGWRRLKICLPILLANIRSRGPSHPTSDVTESKNSLVISIRSLMSIPNMASLLSLLLLLLSFHCFPLLLLLPAHVLHLLFPLHSSATRVCCSASMCSNSSSFSFIIFV